MNIKVLGTGCRKCQELYERTMKATAKAGVEAQVEYVKDPEKICEYTFITPALVVEDRVVVTGKVPTVEELAKILSGEG